MKKRASESTDSPETTKKFKSYNQNENSEDDDHMWFLEYPDSPTVNYSYPEEDVTEALQGLQRQNARCAGMALKFYNEKYHTNYQLVDAITSNGILYDKIWIHCNFTAKEQRTCNGDSPTKLFFAEICGIDSPPYLSVTNCLILKGKEYAGCMSCKDKSCSEGIKHPSSGFRFAQNYRLYALRSRSRRG